MSERICETCGKLLNGKKFLASGRYKADCVDCRAKTYQARWVKEKRRRERMMQARVMDRAIALDARSRRVAAKEMLSPAVAMLKRIWSEETANLRGNIGRLRKKAYPSEATTRLLAEKIYFRTLFDNALAKQIDMLQAGAPVLSIPYILDMVSAAMPEKLSMPDNLMGSMDTD